MTSNKERGRLDAPLAHGALEIPAIDGKAANTTHFLREINHSLEIRKTFPPGGAQAILFLLGRVGNAQKTKNHFFSRIKRSPTTPAKILTISKATIERLSTPANREMFSYFFAHRCQEKKTYTKANLSSRLLHQKQRKLKTAVRTEVDIFTTHTTAR